MTTIEQLEQPTVVRGLATVAERLKHDLGKYVGLQARWLPPEAGPKERREALVADLLHTRRGPDEAVSAHDVWGPFAAMLTGAADLPGGDRVDLSADPDVASLRQRMGALAVLTDASAIDALGDEALARALSDCVEVAACCRSLVRRAREQARAVSPPTATED